MSYKPVYLTDPVEIAEALVAAGFVMDAKKRPDTNNKLQFRLTAKGGDVISSLSIVPTDEDVARELAHSHHGQDENYFILKGSMILAIEGPGAISWVQLLPGQSYLVPKGIPHNAYVYPGTISIVTKIGVPVPCPTNKKDADWWPESVLGEMTDQISPQQATDFV